MKNVIDPIHSIPDTLVVSDVADVETNLCCQVWRYRLKTMSHVVLLFLIS